MWKIVINLVFVSLAASLDELGNLDKLQPPVNIDLLYMGECDDSPDLPVSYHDVTLSRIDEDKISISGTVVVKEETPASIETSIALYRCESEDSEDSCELYENWGPHNGCADLEAKKGTFYSMFKQAKMGHVKCPLQVGESQIVDYIMEIPKEPAAVAVKAGRIWRVKLEASSGDTPIMCSQMLFELTTDDKAE